VAVGAGVVCAAAVPEIARAANMANNGLKKGSFIALLLSKKKVLDFYPRASLH